MTDATTAGDGPDRQGPPSFVDLVDWIEGRLTRTDALAMESRVRNADEATAKTVDWIRGFLNFGRRNPLPAPPPILRQRLRQSFERHHGRAGELVRMSAALSFDSRDDAVLSGVRGGFDIDDGYRLAFAAEALGVLIDVIPEPDGTVQLDGQVLSADTMAPVWAATVEQPSGSITDIGGDGDGCFSVSGVRSDATRLVLSNGLVEIEVPRPLGEPGI